MSKCKVDYLSSVDMLSLVVWVIAVQVLIFKNSHSSSSLGKGTTALCEAPSSSHTRREDLHWAVYQKASQAATRESG